MVPGIVILYTYYASGFYSAVLVSGFFGIFAWLVGVFFFTQHPSEKQLMKMAYWKKTVWIFSPPLKQHLIGSLWIATLDNTSSLATLLIISDRYFFQKDCFAQTRLGTEVASEEKWNNRKSVVYL